MEVSFCCRFAVLPECRFFIPAPISAALPCSRRRKLCIARFRAKHEKFAHSVAPPLPKKSFDFSGTPAVFARSYPNRTVIQLLKGVGKLYPFTCSDWERKNYRVFWKPKIKFPLTHLDKGGQNAHPKSVLCEKKLRKNLSFHLFPPGEMKWTPFF